jgi:hypothetical protein
MNLIISFRQVLVLSYFVEHHNLSFDSEGNHGCIADLSAVIRGSVLLLYAPGSGYKGGQSL